MNKRILIVGGVAGGASAAARSRRLDENAEIIMFEKGPVVSFSNCCLPYHISGIVEQEESLILMTPEAFKGQYKIDAVVNSEVVSVNTKDKTIDVKNILTNEISTESYDSLVISPGADAVIPQLAGLDKIDHYCLKTVPDVSKIVNFVKTKKPKHMTVVGGGFIGLEASENLKEAGIAVTLIEGNDQIIPFVDKEMSYFGQDELIKNGVEVILNDTVTAFDTKKVLLKSGKSLDTDGVILAVGVKPATKFLENSGIELTDQGYIVTNDNYETTAENVYGAGDAILKRNQLTGQLSPLSMAGPANKQGRLIADRIAGRKINNKGYIGSAVVKLFDMNIASTGLSEKMLKNTNINYEVAYAAPPGRVGLMPGSDLIFSKLIFEKGTGKILGGQFASKGASDKRADIVATAIKGNMTIEDLFDLELTYAPTFGTGKDVVNKIGYIASNLNEGFFEQVTFKDVYDLLKSGEQVIDVREVIEYEAGSIKGVKNIPMSVMRERLSELDKSKTVYVHCRTGERSYNMTLMLTSNGFKAKNIAGSYEFIKVYENVSCYNDINREDITIGNCQSCYGVLKQNKSI